MKKGNHKIQDKLEGAPTSVGQSKRFRGATERLFYERLRFRGGENLRNMDVLIENGTTSKKVRRIVEKRMCQAYYSRLGKEKPYGNHNRYYEKRAVSYQLHNIGQVENIGGVKRTEATHWRKHFDPITGMRVLKPKLAYTTFEEALQGAEKEKERFHNKKDAPTVYQCGYCGRYHVGHLSQSRQGYKTIVGSAYDMSEKQELHIAG